MKASIPKDEPQRLEALRELEALSIEKDPFFERLVLLASQMLNMPITLITIVEADRQWFKAKVGLEINETSRDVSFCAHAILSDETLVVEDATKDDRFSDNPLVTGEPKIKFYAGAPLITNTGARLGTLCLIDNNPRKIDASGISTLKTLASLASEAIALKKEVKSLNELNQHSKNGAEEININLAHFAHELRSPLSAISGFAELIEGDKENSLSPDKYRFYASNIRESAQHLFSLADRIVCMERLAHVGSQHLEIIGIKELIKSVILSFEGMAAAKSQTITYNAPQSDVLVLADETSLRQILINIITNACKYSQEEAKIIVTLLTTEEHCKIEIIDNGPGIPDDVLAELGKPFIKSQSDIDTTHNGIGLGLSITLNLVKSMNWDFHISRGSDCGTCAQLYIPLE